MTWEKVQDAEAETIPQSVLLSRNEEQSDKFENVEARETTCAILKSMLVDTKVSAETSFWQINWCRVHLPDKDADIANNDNSRLWMLVAVEDETGQVKVFMREQAALSLAGADTKEEFESLRADDVLEFPAKASIKVIRKPAESPTNSADKPARIHCYIVEAKEQDIAEPPSKSSLILMDLLEKTERSTSACLPASLSMIKKDLHYGLSVSYIVGNTAFKKTCTRAVVLVTAHAPSVPQIMNGGYRMITERVRDPMHDSFECTLMAFCTVKTSADYQLKPSRRTKTQTAYAVIVDILEEGSAGKPTVFLVESLSKLEEDEAVKAPDHMSRRIQFAAQATAVQGKNKNRDWTEETNPAIASKCRKLGRAPTDKPLEEYEFARRANSK